tara:strand:+ start:729 stop:1808 length:1080 start_codon:yes stop_codon:yes gene_type:complete
MEPDDDASAAMSGCCAWCVGLFSAQPPRNREVQPLMAEEDEAAEEGSKLAEYAVGRALGEGNFAVVKLGTHRASGRRVALKLIDRVHSDAAAVEHEVNVLQKVGQHRHICSLVDSFELTKSWVMVLELVSGGEVFDRLCAAGPYTESDAAHTIRQIAEALAHAHSLGVAHRDIKPENLLLVNSSEHADVKLCDFGLACVLDEAGVCVRNGRVPGTISCMAPEAVREEAHGAAVDVWALGVVLHILLSGRNPLDPNGRASEAELTRRIASGKLGAEIGGGGLKCWEHVSRAAVDAVRFMLNPSAAHRPTAAQLLQLSWLQGAAPVARLPGSNDSLKAFNRARRHWRALGHVVRAGSLGRL